MQKFSKADFLAFGFIIVSLLLAWALQKVEDDAYITFRYSMHLADGQGAIWNLAPSVPVEGYSNFLWMLMMALPQMIGLDVVSWSIGAGILFLGLSLLVLWPMTKMVSEMAWKRLLIFACIAFNYTLLCYSSSGLETSMNVFLWMAFIRINLFIIQYHHNFPNQFVWAWAGLAFLILLSRPDGAVLVVIASLFLLPRLRADNFHVSDFWVALGVMGMLFLGWLAFKWSFYGSLLPNTFYVKANGFQIKKGIYYIAVFGLSYGLWSLPIVLSLRFRSWSRNMADARFRFLSILVLAWTTYLICIGGDYMEFRMVAPLIPVLFLLGTALLNRLFHQKWIFTSLAVFFLSSNVVHANSFGKYYFLNFISPVHPFVSSSSHFLSLSDQGKQLNKLLGEVNDLRVATGNCGAVAYYNELQWTDLYGLNHHFDPTHYEKRDFGPGHQYVRRYDGLLASGVHLLMVSCHHEDNLQNRKVFRALDPDFNAVLGSWEPGSPDAGPDCLSLPLGNGFYMLFLYLQAHGRIEELIVEYQLDRKKLVF